MVMNVDCLCGDIAKQPASAGYQRYRWRRWKWQDSDWYGWHGHRVVYGHFTQACRDHCRWGFDVLWDAIVRPWGGGIRCRGRGANNRFDWNCLGQWFECWNVWNGYYYLLGEYHGWKYRYVSVRDDCGELV